MKAIRPIEEQVGELSEKQKKNIIKINRYGIIAILFTTLLSLAALAVAAVMFLKTPNAYLHLNKFVITVVAIVIANLVICILEYVVLIAKFKYFSDKKCSYIKKQGRKKAD